MSLITDGLGSVLRELVVRGLHTAPGAAPRLVTRGLGGSASLLLVRGLAITGQMAARSLRSALRAILVQDVQLLGLVGSPDRIGYLQPGDFVPCLLFDVLLDVRQRGIAGSQGWREARVQFDWYAHDPTLANAMLDRLAANFEALMGVAGGLRFGWGAQAEDGDSYEEPAVGADVWYFHARCDYRFKYFVDPVLRN